MKGTENIIGHIRSEAEAKAEEIIAAAEARCAQIKSEYDLKAKNAYTEKIRAGVRECEDRAESMKKIAGMEARKSLLGLKQKLVSSCFDRAHDKIVSLPEDEYVTLLAKLASESAVSGDEEIVLNARDKAAVGEKVTERANAALAAKGGKAELTLSGDEGSFTGGLMLRRGNIETNCTAELLVNMCRSDMAASLAGVLFE